MGILDFLKMKPSEPLVRREKKLEARVIGKKELGPKDVRIGCDGDTRTVDFYCIAYEILEQGVPVRTIEEKTSAFRHYACANVGDSVVLTYVTHARESEKESTGYWRLEEVIKKVA